MKERCDGSKSRICMLAGLMMLGGCAGKRLEGSSERNPDRLEILTSYTMSLSKKDFQAAAAMLVARDRDRLMGLDGKVRPDFQERLRAMRLTTLASNPLVTLERGRISGIYDLLPVIDQGPPASLVEDVPPSPPAPAPAAEPGREELRAASEAFFRSVRAREYRKALGLLAPAERGVFLREDGRVKDGARRRLAAVDTSAWRALTLEEGKLTGVVLIIPPRPPDSHLPATR